MASRYIAPVDPAERGTFVVDRKSEGLLDIYYQLSPERMASLELDSKISTPFRLLTIHEAEGRLTMYPVNTLPSQEKFLTQKYVSVESITLEGFDFDVPRTTEDIYGLLDELPPGFVKDPEYGLGLQHDFRFIIESIEENPYLRHLVITKRRNSVIDGDTHYVRASEFDAVRRGLNRIQNEFLRKARLDKRIFVHNALMTSVDRVSYPEKRRPYLKDSIFKVVRECETTATELSDSDSLCVVKLISQNKRKLAQAHPKELIKLQHDIELITLEALIEKIEAKISKGSPEADWQAFFSENHFILSLAFGLPVLAIGEQIAVGGMAIDRKGEKYADFLHKNNFTDNLTLIEIKTSKARLLGKEYRGGVFPPATELSGAVSQVLDQRYQLQKGLIGIKDRSRRYDLESYSIKCMVVIGLMPTNVDEKKSFELYRNGLNDVLIVTFDELLVKLKHLYEFLQATQGSTSDSASSFS